MLNLPNILTVSRILAIPVIVALFYVPQEWAAWTCLAIYIIAAATDYFDGLLARWMKQTSDFGTFLDPVSDKIFVGTVLVLLVGFDRLTGIWLIPAIVIMTREFLIAGLREYLAPKNVKVPVMVLAKWKTGIQMVALGFLVIGPHGEPILPVTMEIGQWGLALAAVLTVVTGWNYMKAGIEHIN